MKKYFTKYLPVEDKIKENDKALNPGNGKVVTVNEACLKNLVDDDWKKVKLFLCDKDIQVGDKVNTILNNIICNGIIKDDLYDKWLIESSFTGIKIDKDKSFKVIGQISKDAVWVKEGDEFDEQQVEGNIHCIKHPDESIYFDNIDQLQQWNNINFNQNKYIPIIQIICPTCKTFH